MTRRGAGGLAGRLRREYGVPVLPEGELGQAAVIFQAGCPLRERVSLELSGPSPRLAGLSIAAPRLEERDREDLPLLAALWEGGRLSAGDIKIT